MDRDDGMKDSYWVPVLYGLGVRIYDEEYKGVDVHKRFPNPIRLKLVTTKRLRSASDNDRRSKRFCSIAVLCVSFT